MRLSPSQPHPVNLGLVSLSRKLFRFYSELEENASKIGYTLVVEFRRRRRRGRLLREGDGHARG